MTKASRYWSLRLWMRYGRYYTLTFLTSNNFIVDFYEILFLKFRFRFIFSMITQCCKWIIQYNECVLSLPGAKVFSRWMKFYSLTFVTSNYFIFDVYEIQFLIYSPISISIFLPWLIWTFVSNFVTKFLPNRRPPVVIVGRQL